MSSRQESNRINMAILSKPVRCRLVARFPQRNWRTLCMDEELACAKCGQTAQELHGDNVLKYAPCGHRLYVSHVMCCWLPALGYSSLLVLFVYIVGWYGLRAGVKSVRFVNLSIAQL